MRNLKYQQQFQIILEVISLFAIKMKKLSIEISNKILTIGPDYKNHRGGIGAVIEIYSQNFEKFQFSMFSILLY